MTSHYPGETALRLADIVVVAKTDSAHADDARKAIENARRVRPEVPIVRAASPVRLDDEDAVRGRRVLVVEDGPTITHGGMSYGAGFVAATRAGAARIVDPRPRAVGELAKILGAYPHIGPVLPAVGYSKQQLDDLERTIERTDAEVVVAATPVNLGALIRVSRPLVRARYEFAEVDSPGLAGELDRFLDRIGLRSS